MTTADDFSHLDPVLFLLDEKGGSMVGREAVSHPATGRLMLGASLKTDQRSFELLETAVHFGFVQTHVVSKHLPDRLVEEQHFALTDYGRARVARLRAEAALPVAA